MSFDVVPSVLKDNCLFLMDYCLYDAKKCTHIGLSLYNKISNSHISTGLVLKYLLESDDIDFSFVFLNDEVVFGSSGEAKVIVISDKGDSYLLKKDIDGEFSLLSVDACGEAIVSKGSVKYLREEFSLISKAFCIDSISEDKNSAHIHRGGTLMDENYSIRHFFIHKPTIISIIATSVFMTLLSVATPLGFQTFTDKILPYSAKGSLYVVVILLLLAGVASSVFKCYHDFQENVLIAKYQNGLGKEVFRRLLAMNIPYFDRNKVGDLTKLVDQVEEASNFLVRQALSSFVSLISLIVVLPILFMYSPMLTGIVSGIGVFMALTIAVALKPIRKRVMQAYTYDAGFQSTLIETIKGIKTIKSLANESHFRNRSNIALETNLYGCFNVARLSNVVRALVSFQSQLITIVVIFFGAQAVFSNQLTIGQLIAFNMLSGNVVNPLVSLVMAASGWENFKLANQKLNELVPPTAPVMLLDAKDVDLNGDIEFENVWFRYPSEDTPLEDEGYVLKGVSFTVKKGEILGVVGSSGSGKSTLASLLMGFYRPSKGKIKINGYDISLLPENVLRSHISSVQQTSFLFNTSIMENVHLGRLNSNLEDIQEALKGSGADSFVDEMPQKFLTQLSEDGGNLSGGQRQRIAIARALVRQSDILLFDEATSALDNQTEERIKDTIYQACQDKTGLIIAHRLNTLSYCDRLVVMNQGEVEAIGSHHELLAGENSYRTMWASLSRGDNDGTTPLLLNQDAIMEEGQESAI